MQLYDAGLPAVLGFTEANYPFGSRLTIVDDRLTFVANDGYRIAAIITMALVSWFLVSLLIHLVKHYQTSRSPPYLLFAFAVSAVLSLTLYATIFEAPKRYEFCLDSQRATTTTDLWGFSNKTEVPYAEILDFIEHQDSSDSDSDSAPEQRVMMRTRGRGVFVGGSVTGSEESMALLGRLKEHWARLKTEGESTLSHALVNSPKNTLCSLTRQELESVTPPFDNSWAQVDEGTEVTLMNSGWFDWRRLFGWLIMCIFWNSVLVVLIGNQLRWWSVGSLSEEKTSSLVTWTVLGPMLFLGFVLINAVVINAIDPLRISRWRIGSSDLSYSVSWLGVGNHEQFSIEPNCHLAIDWDHEGLFSKLPWSERFWKIYHLRHNELESIYRVHILAEDGRGICTIDGLSVGEAEWFAALLLKKRSAWFTSQ